MKKLLVVLVCVMLVGCAISAGVVKLSPDTYMISRASAGGAFANMSTLKARVVKEASEFAQDQGKIAIPLSLNENRPPIGFPSIEYQFRVVDKNDPEARRTHLIKGPDLLIKREDFLDANINIKTKDDSKKSFDLYAELMKLEDLRKQGIITDEEFQAQKKILLSK